MKRILDCHASDFAHISAKDLLAAIGASEGRVIACETIGSFMPMLGDITNAEFVSAMGADILLLNLFDVQKPVINALPKCAPEDTVRKLKQLTGRPVGINLEPIEEEIAGQYEGMWAMTSGRIATLENAKKAADMGVDMILLTGNPGMGVKNSAIVHTLNLYKKELGDKLILAAGKMHASGTLEGAENIITKDDVKAFVDAGADIIRVWGTAPERENIEVFVKAAKAANPEVRFAVTHSEATPQQIEKLMPYGLCIGTHHTNATGTIVNYPECRGVCVDEAVNYNHEIYAEIISDSLGIHVDPYMQRLIRKIKGDDRIILITDQTAYNDPPPPGFEHITDLFFSPRADGTTDISGSKLTLDVACRNWMKHTGASIVDAFRCASYNPARAVGFDDRGEIAVGKRADLIITDPKMNVSTVILAGQVVKQ